MCWHRTRSLESGGSSLEDCVYTHSKIFFRWYFLASARSADEAAPMASAAEGEGRG